MTGQGNGAAQPQAEAPTPPRIVITFAGPDRASCSITPEGQLTVAQIYGAAWLLETWAQETRTRELMQAGGGITPAGGDLPSLLRSLGLGG